MVNDVHIIGLTLKFEPGSYLIGKFRKDGIVVGSLRGKEVGREFEGQINLNLETDTGRVFFTEKFSGSTTKEYDHFTIVVEDSNGKPQGAMTGIKINCASRDCISDTLGDGVTCNSEEIYAKLAREKYDKSDRILENLRFGSPCQVSDTLMGYRIVTFDACKR